MPPIPGTPDTLVAENSFPNPSFELDGVPVEVMRNYSRLSVPTASQGWFSNNAAHYVRSFDATGGRRPGLGAAKFVRSTESPNNVIASAYGAGNANWSTAGRQAVSEGEVWVVSSYIKADRAFRGRMNLRFYNAGVQVGGDNLSAFVSGAANEWVRVSVTVTVPAGATEMGAIATDAYLPTGGVIVGGETAWMTDALFDKYPTLRDFWDGYGPSPDSDLAPQWLGSAGQSASILTGMSIPDVTVTNAVFIRSQKWAKSGAYSGRLISTSASVPGSVFVTSVPPSATHLVTSYIESPLAGYTSGNQAGSLRRGSTQDKRPNTPGEYEHRLFASSGTSLEIWGGVRGGGDLWVDCLAIVPGSYDGAYFDGDTTAADGYSYRWTGDPHDSSSFKYVPGIEEKLQYYCNVGWFRDEIDSECHQAIPAALDEELPYEAGNIPDQAPWYSPYSGDSIAGPSRKFLGVYGLSVSSLSDSTRSVGITEGILNGGVLGRERLAVPRFRFRVALTAVDEEGLEYGKAWLSKALGEQNCNTHGPSCGSSDLTFFAACPIYEPDPNGPPQSFDERMDMFTRMYHDVKCVSGPVTVVDNYRRAENSWGSVVEFDLAAGVPTMFGVPTDAQIISQDNGTIIQDIPLNAIPYPSAELASGDVTVSTNLAPNPSVEANATGWQFGGIGVAPGLTTGARVTGELAANGTSSYRVRLLGNGTAASGTSGTLLAALDVPLSAGFTPGARPSVSFWGAGIISGGAAVSGISSLAGLVVWLNASDSIISQETLETVTGIDIGGHVFSRRSMTPPAGAVKLRVVLNLALSQWASGTTNSDIRLYADAVAVTVP